MICNLFVIGISRRCNFLIAPHSQYFICRRFLSIFYPPAQYRKLSMTLKVRTESFYASFNVLTDEGYLKVAGIPKKAQNTQGQKDDETEDVGCDTAFLDMLKDLKKGSHLPVKRLMIKEGETSPPKRYNSGSLILAMLVQVS